VADILAANDLAIEPGEPLVIRRTLKADGGSRAFLNDRPCSAALLREVGAALVEVHGQHDDRGLMNPRGHRALLDHYARSDATAVAAAHAGWVAAQAVLADARADLAAATSEREWLAHAAAELTAFAAEPGEEDILAGARATMQKGARLTDDLTALSGLFDGSDGGLSQLRQAARRLDRIAAEHPALEQALAAIDRALIEAGEAEDYLRAAGEALAVDPARLDAIEVRLFDLRALARKYGVAADALSELGQDLAAKLARIDAGEEGLGALEAAEAAARGAYVAAATEVRAARQAAAARLDAAVAGELAPLKLDAARFRTTIDPLDEGQWGPGGMDRVEFLISTNAGAPFAPLIKIASGGELSRFILALKVALAERGGAATIIFDEIDRGVGGAVASAIGERLARLAAPDTGAGQVLVVTHSPQVAARGGAHMLIAKASEGTITRTGIRSLSDAERREEIARMLSGAAITPEARAQADRLLEGV
jgi:DNA repair protein RecN (Recombination protein N)